MQDYYAPAEWYEPDVDPVDTSEWVHVDELPDMDWAKKRMKMVLDSLYGNIDLLNMESALEDVCMELGIEFEDKPLRIAKIEA